jgi:ferric-dicitrate binding protein FerR (iron transport regulator)
MTNYSIYEVEDFLHDDFFINWVLKSTSEHEEFWQQWLLKNPDRKKIVEKAQLIVASIVVTPLPNELTDTEVTDIVKHVQQYGFDQPDEPGIIHLKFYQTKWFRIAAMLMVCVTAGLLFLKKRSNNTQQEQSIAQANPYLNIINNTTESKLVRMSDGSLAVLKPGSGLKYPKNFQDKREAFLTGEAFFEIHKNPQMPFLVHSHDMVVRVLGTSFMVKTADNNQQFKVIVNTGKVLVYNQKTAPAADQKHAITLVPNEEVTYESKQQQFKKETLAVPLILSKEIAQKELNFDNTPLAVIIEKIEKAYDVHIEYDKAKLGNKVLTASLSDRPLDEKVKLICKAINVSCEFTDGRIIIIDNQNPIPTN